MVARVTLEHQVLAFMVEQSMTPTAQHLLWLSLAVQTCHSFMKAKDLRQALGTDQKLDRHNCSWIRLQLSKSELTG
ncbi:hypothetical protein DPMN_121197 [Dreissena polymorpha]|uniref:Uncharacterized protein n=1 Tax=Dreissena polymorpha TaxID=45954 RepID=A0A9D4GQ27_DREPO|nr:hypothetical protein DPMN_121197 [Dreissena polymorpha]